MKPYSTAIAAITLMLLSTPGAFSFPEPKLRGAVYLESDAKETLSANAVKISEDDMDGLVEGNMQCEGSGDIWATCQNFVQGGDPVKEVINATDWWYTKIYPYIPEDELQYYQEPFGGASQPANYIYGVAETLLSEVSDFQAIQYSHSLGGRRKGTRAAIHRHDFGATTHVLQGYSTLFLEGQAPVTKGPGESYFMPGGGLTMAAAIMPNPVYNGKLVEQPDESRNLDINAWPLNSEGGITIWLEKETDSDGNVIFDWTLGNRTRCNVPPRFSCY